jgi:hypothetical protein
VVMARSMPETSVRTTGLQLHWSMHVRTWIVPLLAAATAALGAYVGVVRSIDELRTELRVAQAETRTTIASIDRRLSVVEERLQPDAATQRDIAELLHSGSTTAEHMVDRHEAAYHRHQQ